MEHAPDKLTTTIHPFQARCQHAVLLLALSLALSACSSPFPDLYYLTAFPEMIDRLLGPMRLVFAFVGLALLVAGWKLYRFVVALPGLVLGAALGFVLGGSENELLAVVGLILGAGIGAGLALLLHDLVIFILGAVGAAIMVFGLWGGLDGSFPPALVLIIAGLIGGGVLVALSKVAIVFLSAYIGASLFGLGTGLTGLWILLFFALGVVVQYGLAKAMGEKVFGVKEADAQPALTPAQIGGGQVRVDHLAGSPPVLEQRPHARAVLEDETGRRFPIQDGATIGRGSDCNIHLGDRSISRLHAVLRFSHGAWFIQDQGSKGGTRVNGQRVQATRLNPGDRITIGERTLTFRER